MKTASCAINTHVSQIKAKNASEYAEKVLEILNPHVIEYIDASNKPLDLFENQPESKDYFKAQRSPHIFNKLSS